MDVFFTWPFAAASWSDLPSGAEEGFLLIEPIKDLILEDMMVCDLLKSN